MVVGLFRSRAPAPFIFLSRHAPERKNHSPTEKEKRGNRECERHMPNDKVIKGHADDAEDRDDRT